MRLKEFQQDHPIPGESLTNSPENRLPYEQAPVYNDPVSASKDIWKGLSNRGSLSELFKMLRKDIPVADIAQTVTFAGFAEGKWTQDVAVQLLQPTMLMIMDLANTAGVEFVFSKEMPSLKAEIDKERDKLIMDKMKGNAPPSDIGLMTGIEDTEVAVQEEDIEQDGMGLMSEVEH